LVRFLRHLQTATGLVQPAAETISTHNNHLLKWTEMRIKGLSSETSFGVVEVTDVTENRNGSICRVEVKAEQPSLWHADCIFCRHKQHKFSESSLPKKREF
jgi:hypothetical protein